MVAHRRPPRLLVATTLPRRCCNTRRKYSVSFSLQSLSLLVLLCLLFCLPTVTQANVVVQLASTVKHSITKTVEGCGQLWTNHGRCKDIRHKLKLYRDQTKQGWEDQGMDITTNERKELLKKLQGGITFEEYVFLESGKADRGKVLNLLFLMWGAPRFLPYALMFNPDMLPSPFRSSDGKETIWAKQSRERSTAVIEALLRMEKDAIIAPAMEKLNIFGKKQQEERREQLGQMVRQTGDYMQTLVGITGANTVLTRIDSWLYRNSTDFDRSERRLCHVPTSIVQGINAVLGGTGFLTSLQPHFMTRGRVVTHLRKVTDADEFLVNANIDLSTVSKRLLQEACSERLMWAGPGGSKDELRQHLMDWLQLTVHQPNERITTGTSPECYYNGNLARLALMGYYSCLATRDSRNTLQLPRLLFTGPEDVMTRVPEVVEPVERQRRSFNLPFRR